MSASNGRLGNFMKRKRCSVLILATALLIIGMRGVCAAHYSEHVSIDHDQQSGSLQLDRTGSHVMHERIRTNFNFRVKRFSFSSKVTNQSWRMPVPPRGSGWVKPQHSKSIAISHTDHQPTRYRVVVLTRSKPDVGLLTQNWSSSVFRRKDCCPNDFGRVRKFVAYWKSWTEK